MDVVWSLLCIAVCLVDAIPQKRVDMSTEEWKVWVSLPGDSYKHLDLDWEDNESDEDFLDEVMVSLGGPDYDGVQSTRDMREYVFTVVDELAAKVLETTIVHTLEGEFDIIVMDPPEEGHAKVWRESDYEQATRSS